jgi:ParB-like chromosome segregation protein Spo0J
VQVINLEEFPIEKWDIADVVPYPFNNKKHPPKHIDMLAKSIEAQGHLEAIAIDEDGVIISGHGRHLALQKLGRTQVMVRVLRGLSEAQKTALRIAANKTVGNEYDTDMLAIELEKLNDGSFDLSSMGFEQKELDMLLIDVGEIDEDSITIDIGEAVETHEADVEERAAAVDGNEVRLDKAFGFKVLPLRDQKVVTRFMAEIEVKTGLAGSEALIVHMKNALGAI